MDKRQKYIYKNTICIYRKRFYRVFASLRSEFVSRGGRKGNKEETVGGEEKHEGENKRK